MSELQEIIFNKRPGEKVTLTFMRDKKKMTKTVTLKNAQGNTKIVKTADLDVLGGNFRAVTDQQKKALEINYGLEVTKVSNGALKTAGINKGFIIQEINDTPMKSLDDLQTIVKSASTSKDPVLYVKGIWPTGKKDYFAVQISE
jgi:S1-C subfamily serine protease